MAKRVYEEANIEATAEKMRELTGTSTEYTTYDFADGVEEVYNVGKETGYAEGYDQGLEAGKAISYDTGYADGNRKGYADGIEQGKQAEYDKFWDAYQENGERTDYRSAFASYYWNEQTLRPKYTLKVVGNGGASTFDKCYFEETNIDNSRLLDISHVSIDVTEATDCGSMFSNAKIKEVTLLFSEALTTLYQAFTKGARGGVEGMKITLLVPNPNCNWNSAFAYHKVKELNLLEGTVIGTNGFNVQWATGLPKSSIISIINALSDSTSGLSVTFSKQAVNDAFREYGSENGGDIYINGSNSDGWKALIATKPNWTINLV